MEVSLIFVLVALLLTIGAQPVLLWLVRRRKIGATFWILVEYAWIAMAIFALWFALTELERLHAMDDVAASRVEVEVEWRQIVGSATFTRDLLGHGGARTGAGEWFKYLVTVLDLGYTSPKWAWFVGQNENLWRPRQSASESRIPQGQPWTSSAFATKSRTPTKHAPSCCA